MLCVTDCRLPRACRDELLRLGIEPVLLPPHPSLSAPIASHADLLLFSIGKTVLTHKSYATIAERELSRISECGYEIRLCDTAIGESYPNDVSLCACALKKHAICNVKYTCGDAVSLAKQAGLSIVDVSQGYAKCSCAALSDGAVISADAGICKAFSAQGGEALLISSGHVKLPPYQYGFIGGASGLCGDTLYFAGGIERHPDYEKIRDFCARHKTPIRSLSDEVLFDVGSMIFL